MADGIPIENIYFLLCYSWNRLEEKEQVPVDISHVTEIVDLLARVLDSGLSHLIRRGYDRGYTTFEEDLPVLRGRMLMSETMRRGLQRRARVHCRHDELSHDVLHNRILKNIVARLLRTPGIDEPIVANLVVHRHRMHTVSDMVLSDTDFSRVVLHRNNFFYDFLLRIAQLIHHNLLPSEVRGEYRFRSFDRDPVRMRLLFEEFIRNFYKRELSGRTVKRDELPWNLKALTPGSELLLPKMQTDISILYPGRRTVIECKYTARHFQQRDENAKQTFRSEHLYQLSAYLRTLRENHPGDDIEGILLYPTVGEHLSHEFHDTAGQRLRVCSIDLKQSWQKLYAQLMEMVGERDVIRRESETLYQHGSSHPDDRQPQLIWEH